MHSCHGQTALLLVRRAASALVAGFFAVLACDLATAAEAERPLSFQNDVMAVLSKAGCNAGVCHGNLNGKGGFKLSLRGQDPATDYETMVRGQLGRRIDT